MANRYEIWLASQIQEPAVIDYLMKKYFTAEGIYLALGKGDVINEGIPAQQFEVLKQNATEWKIEQLFEDMDRFGVRFVQREEVTFPKRLLSIPGCPYGLFYQGRLPEENRPAMAIVGARSASSYGDEVARYFAKELAKAGVQIISGLALGIDGMAHRGALEGGDNTYGILGSGIGTPYPKENWNLYYQMLEQGGVLSEYPPHMPALKYHFPRRNRLISGLSDGVLVIEARKRSGTLITVDQALEQGRDVYAIPGRITDDLSVGCNQLIQQGARLVLDPEEILEELGKVYPLFRMELSDNRTEQNESEKNSLASEEKIVYACLRLNLRHFDALVDETGIRPQKLAGILLSLEEKGMIRQPAPNYYASVHFM